MGRKHALNVIELLSKYRDKSILISLDEKGENIRLRGNLAALNSADKKELTENKEAIIDFLKLQKKKEVTITPHKKRIEHIPLSPGQQDIWVHDQIQKDAQLYLVPGFYQFELPQFDPFLFKQALEALVQENEVLAYVFKDENGIPFQKMVAVSIEEHYSFYDCVNTPHLDWDELVDNSVTKGFDYENIPPWELTLGHVAPGKYACFLKIHHLIADGKSIGLFFDKLIKSYQSILSGEPLAKGELHYQDYTVWLGESENLVESNKYWTKLFEDYDSDNNIPELLHPVTQQAITYKKELDKHAMEQIRSFAKENRLTTSAIYSAGLALLLTHNFSWNDFTIGIPVEGRPLPELENVLGHFINTLPLRFSFDKKQDEEFIQLMNAAQSQINNLLTHQLYPLNNIRQNITAQGETKNTRLFNVLLSVPTDVKVASAQSQQPYAGSAKFDLSFTILEQVDSLSFSIEGAGQKFTKDDLIALGERFENVLNTLIANPKGKCFNSEVLTVAEQEKIIGYATQALTNDSKAETVLDLFQTVAFNQKDKCAVQQGTEQLSYQELDELSTQFANYLADEKVIDQGGLVGIKMERSVRLIPAILGVLKAGMAYVPIDPNYPAERIEYIKKDSGAVCCIDEEEWRIFLNRKKEFSAQPKSGAFDKKGTAYIIYTSGSTGKPKGVKITHNNLAYFLKWAHSEFNELLIDNVLFSTSICFDLSVFEMFYTLTTGKTIQVLQTALAIPSVLAKHSKCLINTVPSAMASLIEGELNWENISGVNLAGEKIGDELIVQLLERNIPLRNLYGPSEDTTYSTCLRITESNAVKGDIGFPIDNTELYILTRYKQLAGIQQVGEIYLGGKGLAQGYLNRPELTAEKFIPHPFKENKRLYRTGDLAAWQTDGSIEIIGRIDDQVKVRGYRVEIGEIEHALVRIKPINEALVLANKRKEGGYELVACYTVNGALEVSQLRDELKAVLPAYMIPSQFFELNEIPKTLNGKKDRKATGNLWDKRAETRVIVEPKSITEEKVLSIWKSVLDKATISTADKFFEIGGDSLKAIRVLASIEKELDVKLNYQKMFDVETIHQLALEIDNIIWMKAGKEETVVKKVII